jgi:hypothetical protein
MAAPCVVCGASRLDFNRQPTTIYWVAAKGYYSYLYRRKTAQRRQKVKGKTAFTDKEQIEKPAVVFLLLHFAIRLLPFGLFIRGNFSQGAVVTSA